MSDLLELIGRLEHQLKHLPGRHNQQRHAGSGGGVTHALYKRSGEPVTIRTPESVRLYGDYMRDPFGFAGMRVDISKGQHPVSKSSRYELSSSYGNKPGRSIIATSHSQEDLRWVAQDQGWKLEG